MGPAQTVHGPWCNLHRFTYICKHCGGVVVYVQCDHGRAYYDAAGGPWSEHNCLESQLAQCSYQLYPRTAMSVALELDLQAGA